VYVHRHRCQPHSPTLSMCRRRTDDVLTVCWHCVDVRCTCRCFSASFRCRVRTT
jgi:hypothetical protein